MFGKKCKRCNRKIDKNFEFCPYCGFNLKREQDEKDYGFLGKEDRIGFPGIGLKMPFGFSGFDKVFSSLMKQIDSQFKEIDKEIGKDKADFERARKSDGERKPGIMSRGLSISISTGTGMK